jgi:hypothetical protein
MKTVPIVGTATSVTFFEDDTIETVRQSIALAVNSHPDRLFIEVKADLPKDYYATNPKHWTDLFLRLSFDGLTIPSASLKTYVEQCRPGAGVVPRDVTREQWEDRTDDLKPLFDPDTDFQEWRILGVEDVKSFVLPLPPQDLPQLRAGSRPNPQTQSLFETLHPYDVTEFRVLAVSEGASPLVKLNYFPRFRADTPPNIESLRDSIETSKAQLQQLLDLDTPKHETVSIVRAKWYIPLLSTRITAPRSRFEQMFYGMTVSKETPYVGYFTAKTETTRHKFYVTDPKTKTPVLDIPMWKSWTNNTQPQRRRPTLLLYRGTSRTSFDRIAVTDKDITVDIRREKTSKETLDEMASDAFAWMKTLDALTPFVVASDLEPRRWELSDLSVVASYAKEIREFDMLRMPCLQSLFSIQGDTFRLLRAEHTSEDISPRQLQALQALSQDDIDRSPEALAEQLSIPLAEAQELFAEIAERLEDLNLEKSLKAYPSIKFSPKEVILKFVSNLDRTLQYVDILRHVLTSESEDIDAVCPKRMEKVQAKVAIPQQELVIADEFVADDDFNALLGFEPEAEGEAPTGPEEPAPEGESSAAAPKARKVKVASRAVGTYNYFNNRLQSFDPETFDKSIFPSKCDKPRQPIVLTPADKSRIGPTYDFSGVPESEKLDLNDPDGTAICPPYWCMRDEVPLREDQLEVDSDGAAHCPLCKGKVRTSDTLDTMEYPVIKRDAAAKFPDYIKQISTLNKRKIPCCFQTARASTEVLAPKEEMTYVLDATTATVPGLRFSYLTPELAEQLAVETHYGASVKKGRLGAGEKDIFRVGLGRPSKSLPALLNDKTPILRPRDAKENLLQCSFFRTWKGRGAGDTEIDRIVSSIDSAYQAGDLSLLDELEYVTSFLQCEVIRVDTTTGQVVCGFWSESVGASSRTIAVLDTTVLAQVERAKEKKGYKSEFTADLRKPMFAKTLPILRDRHARACATNMPLLADAVAELQAKGKADYQVILDPFKRIQAAFVPGEVILPVQPTVGTPDKGVPVRSGYADIRDEELPKGDAARAFLGDVKTGMFKVRSDVVDLSGRVVELELVSGFRVPIQPEEAMDLPPREVVQTIRKDKEESLVDAPVNAVDKKLADDVSYAAEIYEFLLFSLSKDLQTDDYASLRASVESKSATLMKDLEKWFKTEAYEDSTKTPVEFVNKVRTPCGQFTDKEKCNSSSLCGWKTEKSKGVCKIRVKPVVDKTEVLKRMVKTLRENDKQRALVLDGRMSPFFSTILYLELPHELITTSI